MLANRRIPGEIKKAIRPISAGQGPNNVSNMLCVAEDISIDEMQQKMSDIQHELQALTEFYQKLDPKNPEFSKQKQVVSVKSDKLRKEFRAILMKLQLRQTTSQAIPSDDVIFIYLFQGFKFKGLIFNKKKIRKMNWTLMKEFVFAQIQLFLQLRVKTGL